MRNYQILIDEIRSTFASDELVSPDLYRSLAEDYAKACRDMIGRLKTCISYLRSGNMSEAVRLADVEPNLFDIYNLLDFPEREEWTGVLESFGYKLPPPFPKELAQQLNDAYCRSASLEPLQKRYRVMAVERAPLAERLKVLRSIAAADPINPSWHKDLAAFEEERLKELGHDVDRAVAENNYVEMRNLQKEISQNWTVPVPAHIRDKLNATLRGIRFQSLNRQLEQLVERLQQAHDERNIEQGQSLVDEIREIVGESGMAMPADVSDQAETAVRWLMEEKKRRNLTARYEAALRQLKNELRGNSPIDELSRTHDSLSIAAGDVSQTIPESVEEEYRAALRSRERETKQKQHVGIAVAAVVFVLLLAGMVVAVQRARENRLASQTITVLPLMIDGKNASPSDAEALINDLETNHANLLKRPEIAELVAELKRKIKTDNDRKTLFDEYFQLAKNSTGEGKTPDVLAYQQAVKLALAASENEKNQVDAIRPFFERYIAETQHKTDAAVEMEMSRLTNEASTVRRDLSMTFRERQDKLRTIVASLEQLVRTPGLSDGLLQRLKQATTNTTQAIADLDTERMQNERLEVLLGGVGNAEAYGKALLAYANMFPQHAESSDFRDVAGQSEIWDSLLHTDLFRQALAVVRSREAGEETAAGRALELYRNRYAGIRHFASEEFVRRGVPYLETTAFRTLDPLAEQKPFENVKAVLRELAQRELWTIYASPDGAWFYVLREPTGRGGYPYVTGFYSKSGTRNFDDSFFADVPKVNQYNYAMSALRSLDNITHEKWSDTCYSLARKLFEADGIDPVLKVVLLKRMIADFSKCDSVFAERFQATTALLDDETPEFDNAPNWMDGEAILENPVRDKCRSIIARITFPTTEEMKTAYDRVDAILAERQREYRWIGFTLRRDGEWTLMSRETPSGTLYFVRPDDAVTGYAAELVECGHIDENGAVSFDAETLTRQGEPIFVIGR